MTQGLDIFDFSSIIIVKLGAFGKMGVRVRIFDKEYNLKVNEDEEYLKTIAAYVDNKVRRIASSIPERAGEQISILACLNIADELYKLRGKTRKARERVQQLIEKIEKEAK